MMMRIRRLDLIDLDESFLYQEMKQHLSLLINRVIFRYRLYFDPMMMRIRRLDLIDLDESFLYQEMKQHLS
ncbi:hypothetical protein CP987_19860, partial [Morganella morganii]